MSDIVLSSARRARAEQVIAAVADQMSLDPDDVVGESRRQPLGMARWLIWRVLRDEGWGLAECGAATGGRDHSTVHNGLTNLARACAVDQDLAASLTEIRAWARLGRAGGSVAAQELMETTARVAAALSVMLAQQEQVLTAQIDLVRSLRRTVTEVGAMAGAMLADPATSAPPVIRRVS